MTAVPAPVTTCHYCAAPLSPDWLCDWVADGPGGDYCPGNPDSVNHVAQNYPEAVRAAVAAQLDAPARIEGTGGGCEWINVGPLPGGVHLTITDGDAGLPADEDADAPGWLVQRDAEGVLDRARSDYDGETPDEDPEGYDPDGSYGPPRNHPAWGLV